MEAVILAGRPNDGALREMSPCDWEALVSVGRQTMLDLVAGAFLGLPSLNRLIVVAAQAMRDGLSDRRVVRVPCGETMLENVALGLSARDERGPVFIATSDIPLLTTESLQMILDAAQRRPGYELYFPIVRREALERFVPGARRTYVRMNEGPFTTGNVVLADGEAIRRCLEKAEALVRLRKHPLRLAGLFGFGFVMRLLLRRLGIGQAEERFSRVMGIRVAAVEVDDAGVGMDVDKPEDLERCVSVLSGRP